MDQYTINPKKLRSKPVENAGRKTVVQNMFPRWGRILEGTAIAAFVVISTYAVARVGLEPSDPSRGVGVIFAPWTDADTTLARAANAGGRIVRFGGPSFVVVVEPESADYVRRVRAAGALLIVDPRVIAACFSLTSTVQDRT
jgi:hypothetical protein